MGVSADAPSLDSAYKLVAYGGRPVMKLSEGKATLPGAKQVYRGPTSNHGDLIAQRDELALDGFEPLLAPVMRGGHRLVAADPAAQIAQARQRLDADRDWLPAQAGASSIPSRVWVRHRRSLAASQAETKAAHA